ncbi:uncharacterized protein LOC123310656 isoform X1 [Coccinella septempunctata]|uniref:uncharacterized protein LOC123310656 isoform X1 n=1 Tax=Coccinella septempunctata TaxID=41139 RepID=UPI001D078D8B|nr:uncharacterized protein LOC123310656 isoform X1 [Coccinella septempunctata]XP_044750141.1 uncharacterized protein LOC123310656 isoform X1 [Coccinella septempunctata]XP_044750142.1 uncharacterized protein LOC123310656 isoform X1 [Coccinella septempunctata]XP_044750143.1 uncharacterized protein LOC123310656 isoform X1 [Coccinella septempunctata]XP_044750144.1 uncharacterized protein LOC123310656 isoform X1 [Coccinella septempunctata]
MRWSIYLACAALVISIKADENSVDYYGSFLEPINIAAEQETLNNYLLPKVQPKYKPEWRRLGGTGLYLVTDDLNTDSERLNPETRIKRAEFMRPRGSLSIVNSLDALRNKLVMEMARKKTQQNAERNRQFLQSFGKRSYAVHRNIDRFNNM